MCCLSGEAQSTQLLYFPSLSQAGGSALQSMACHHLPTVPPAVGSAPADCSNHAGQDSPLHDDVALVGRPPALPAPGKAGWAGD